MHWSKELLEVLSIAVLAHNPNQTCNNQEWNMLWKAVAEDYNTAAELRGLPLHDVDAVKQKFQQITNKHKKGEALYIRASGIAEWTSKHEVWLDKYNRAGESWQQSNQPSQLAAERESVQCDQNEFAQMAGQACDDPATWSMASPTQCCTQEPATPLESEGDAGNIAVRKRSCNATHDILASFAENTEQHGQFKCTYQTQQLEFLREQSASQKELTQAQLNMNEWIQTEFRSQMESLEARLQSSQAQNMRMESMMALMMSMLQGISGDQQSGQHLWVSLAPSSTSSWE